MVKKLLIEGLKTRNLYRVGIAIHTYTDSWAHQNFSGLDEEWNTTESSSLYSVEKAALLVMGQLELLIFLFSKGIMGPLK